MTHDFRNRSRQAFTLVELLVVISIIAILAALATWGIFAMVGNQQRRNTEATIKVVNKVLQSQWHHVVKEASGETPSPAVMTLAGGDPARAKVLWVKFRLMEAFPQSFAEIGSPASPPWFYLADPFGSPYIPLGQRKNIAVYQKHLNTPPFIAANNKPATQSAACLLMALSINRGGNVLAADQIGYAVADTDGDGVKELVDGWTRPFAFTRFDLQAQNPAAAGSRAAKFADAVDADGTLINGAWYSNIGIYLPPATTMRGFVDAKVHVIMAGSGNANYVIPAIVSAGKDGIANNGDDVVSYKLRLE